MKYSIVQVIAVIGAVAIFLSTATSAETLSASDNYLTRSLIGSWTIARNSPELHGQQLPHFYVERFLQGGRGQVAVFSDSSCRILIRTVTFGWKIKQHVLITKHPDGSVSRDTISRVEKDSFYISQSRSEPDA